MATKPEEQGLNDGEGFAVPLPTPLPIPPPYLSAFRPILGRGWQIFQKKLFDTTNLAKITNDATNADFSHVDVVLSETFATFAAKISTEKCTF